MLPIFKQELRSRFDEDAKEYTPMKHLVNAFMTMQLHRAPARLQM